MRYYSWNQRCETVSETVESIGDLDIAFGFVVVPAAGVGSSGPGGGYCRGGEQCNRRTAWHDVMFSGIILESECRCSAFNARRDRHTRYYQH